MWGPALAGPSDSRRPFREVSAMTRSKALAAAVFVVLSTSASVVAQAPPAPIRVGGVVRAPQKIFDVRPVYPAAAQAARIDGVVIAELLIGTDGRVQQSRILKSIALLDQAALDAVNQWVFTPTLLDGVAVPILYNVTVSFQLSGGRTAATGSLALAPGMAAPGPTP